MVDQILILAGTVITSVTTSTGVWAYVQKKSDKKSSSTRLMMGLAHMEIVRVGMRYIQRGWVSQSEYQDYLTYLIEPYSDLGGNGMADRIFKSVAALPIQDLKTDITTGMSPMGVDTTNPM